MGLLIIYVMRGQISTLQSTFPYMSNPFGHLPV